MRWTERRWEKKVECLCQQSAAPEEMRVEMRDGREGWIEGRSLWRNGRAVEMRVWRSGLVVVVVVVGGVYDGMVMMMMMFLGWRC